MNRRGFLSSLAALAAAPFVPFVPTPARVPIAVDPIFNVDYSWEVVESIPENPIFDTADVSAHAFRIGDVITLRLPQRCQVTRG